MTSATLLDNAMRRALIEAARQARNFAYAPYSHYRVGAAILTASGKIFGGCNIENAAFSPTLCAERVALVKAISEGSYDLVACVVITENGGSPCGTCRQTLFEFAPNLQILVANSNGDVLYERVLSELLPEGFGPDSLTMTHG